MLLVSKMLIALNYPLTSLSSCPSDLLQERASDRRRIEELLEENLFLEMAQKRSMEEGVRWCRGAVVPW